MDDFEKLLESLSLDSDSLERHWLSLSSLVPIVLAAMMGFLVLWVYVTSSKTENRDRNLFTVIPVLTILMSVIMRIEGAQIVLFFGIFGILSIVRFRSDLTDQKGITFILFSVILGVLVGVGNYLLAFLAFLIVSSAIFLARQIFVQHFHYKLIIKVPNSLIHDRFKVESWLREQKLSFRFVGFSSDLDYSTKNQSWESRRRLEYEISSQGEAKLLHQVEEFALILREWNCEMEVRRSGEGG